MRLLLDTHVLLWWLDNAPELSPAACQAIAHPGSEVLVSMASCWELTIKAGLGKLGLRQAVENFIPEQLALNGFRLLPIDFRHAARVETLPFHHRDPFDRLLIVQAMTEKLVLVTADRQFAAYDVETLW